MRISRISPKRIRRQLTGPLPLTVKPTEADVAIAKAVALSTRPATEEIARALTWGADEKVLLALAAVGWIASRGGSSALRLAGNHALLVTVAASLLPHGLKRLFDQTRPARRTVLGHVHGQNGIDAVEAEALGKFVGDDVRNADGHPIRIFRARGGERHELPFSCSSRAR